MYKNVSMEDKQQMKKDYKDKYDVKWNRNKLFLYVAF